MLHHLAQLVMKIEEGDATHPSLSAGASSPSQDTLLAPDLRPDVMVTPDHVRTKRTVAAALFGTDPEPLHLGRYRLLERLGAGGMGIVYAAYDARLERKLALKLLRPSRLGSAEAVARTLREARALARLSHPHVVHVYEVGELDGREIFVAMEHLAGPTLRAWLDAEPRPWPEVLAVFRQAGEGLAAAHAHGIVHRDFKPHNAMFGADGRVRVLDFGLAQVDGAAEAREPLAAANPDDLPRTLTSTGALLGTPAYMAPEQLAGHKGDARSDQFSFCVALYEALYGHRPFAGETLGELADSVSSERVTPPPRSTDVPAWVRAALLRGLRADPERRWPSMTELLAALSGDPAARRRRRQRWTAVTMGLAGVLTGGAWWAGAHLRSVDAEQRAQLDRQVVSARAEADRQTIASTLAQARGQLERDPAGVIHTLAQLDAIAPADAVEVRTLALAALARGLPDAALVGPEAELLSVAAAADSDVVLAQDATGDLWRWTADDRPGERIARLGQRASTLAVAPSGQAWAAALGGSLVGGAVQDGAWQTWRAALPEPRSPFAHLMITADERWLIPTRGQPLVVLDLRTGQPVEAAFPERHGGDGETHELASPDARFLARGRVGADTITIWDRSTGETRSAPALGALSDLVGVVGDGQILLGRSERDGATRLIAWDLARATAQEWRSDVLGVTDLGGLVGLTRATEGGRTLCVAPPLAADCRWQHPLDQFDRPLADSRHYALETPREQQPRRPLELRDLATGAVVRRFSPGPPATVASSITPGATSPRAALRSTCGSDATPPTRSSTCTAAWPTWPITTRRTAPSSSATTSRAARSCGSTAAPARSSRSRPASPPARRPRGWRSTRTAASSCRTAPPSTSTPPVRPSRGPSPSSPSRSARSSSRPTAGASPRSPSGAPRTCGPTPTPRRAASPPARRGPRPDVRARRQPPRLDVQRPRRAGAPRRRAHHVGRARRCGADCRDGAVRQRPLAAHAPLRHRRARPPRPHHRRRAPARPRREPALRGLSSHAHRRRRRPGRRQRGGAAVHPRRRQRRGAQGRRRRQHLVDALRARRRPAVRRSRRNHAGVGPRQPDRHPAVADAGLRAPGPRHARRSPGHARGGRDPPLRLRPGPARTGGAARLAASARRPTRGVTRRGPGAARCPQGHLVAAPTRRDE
ncbi:protein kinase domain-containing protein [Nannocystis pusilla]|uniref:serine/threonine-protein kinase n=1 Tax=Nannocystis pusilla TaxID=889268 RepID=UPI003B798932